MRYRAAYCVFSSKGNNACGCVRYDQIRCCEGKLWLVRRGLSPCKKHTVFREIWRLSPFHQFPGFWSAPISVKKSRVVFSRQLSFAVDPWNIQGAKEAGSTCKISPSSPVWASATGARAWSGGRTTTQTVLCTAKALGSFRPTARPRFLWAISLHPSNPHLHYKITRGPH